MYFYGVQKLSLLDYPEKLCATLFTGGCNFRCPFCHNTSLVLGPFDGYEIDEEEILEFLESRKGKLDAVCISGGEPLLQSIYDIAGFCTKVKDMGYSIKLDTNGSFPNKIEYLIELKLVDYIAMDIKSSPEGYPKLTGIKNIDLKPIFESVEILKKGKVDYEFRTTFVRELHTAEDVIKIGKWIEGAKKYSIQNFKDSGDILSDGLSGFTRAELEEFKSLILPYVQNVEIKGI